MAKQSEIVAIQSVMPMKVTDPKQRRHVSVKEPEGSGIFQKCLNMVFYYRKEKGEGSEFHVSGWNIKESLGKALQEQPILGGRLRRTQDGHGGLEILSNDSGIRLVEAQIPMNLSELLERKQEEDSETELVFWKDIDEQNPQYFPLFYVQVTNFQCGGYSIGISCSILIADVLLSTDFLKKWVKIHENSVFQNGLSKEPIFSQKKPKSVPNRVLASASRKNRGETMIFKVSGAEFRKEMTLQCLEQTEKKFGRLAEMGFFLVLNESIEEVKVEKCVRHEMVVVSGKIDFKEIDVVKWDDLGENGLLSFSGGNKSVAVSCWIEGGLDEVVLAIPFPGTDGGRIIVAIPNERL